MSSCQRLLGVALTLTLTARAAPVAAQHGAPAARHEARRELAPLSRTDEDGQPRALPPLPDGMTTAMLREGDAIFRGKGGCVSCHGLDGTGVADKGSPLTAGLNYIPKPYSWAGLDSLERHGIPESITRVNVACPVRGVRHDLSDAQVLRVAAYVWAIAQSRGEPWPGGHDVHRPNTRSVLMDCGPGGARSRSRE